MRKRKLILDDEHQLRPELSDEVKTLIQQRSEISNAQLREDKRKLSDELLKLVDLWKMSKLQ